MKHNTILIKVVAASLLALLILAATLQTSIWMAERSMEELADQEAEHKSTAANHLSNLYFSATQWTVYSFLSAFTDCDTRGDTVSFTIADDYLATMTTDDIFTKLESFIDYNYDFSSVVLVFQPGVLACCPNGLAAKVAPGDTVRHNLLDEGFAVYDNDYYKTVCASECQMSRDCIVGIDSSYVFACGMRILDERGNVVGALLVDSDPAFFSKLLVEYKSDDDIISSLVKNDCKIISSLYPENNGRYIKDAYFVAQKDSVPAEWYSEVQKRVLLKSYSHFKAEIAGEVYVTYILPITNTEYNIMIIKPEKAIRQKVDESLWYQYLVVFSGFFLVVLCLIYIFYIFKRENSTRSRMEGELSVAAEIQRSILPPNPEEAPKPTANCQLSTVNCQLEKALPPYHIYGYQRPAKSVGGDLYDFVQKGDYLHFCIGDVSGKGIPAALVMTELCSLYRLASKFSTDAVHIVSGINNAVMERSDDSMFCTLFLGVLNLKTGLLEYCNAGHNPPIYIANGEEPAFMKVLPNMPIYAFENYAYKAETLQLAPGDRLVFYTDGVTEAKTSDNRFFGNGATLASVSKYKNLPFSDLVNGILSDLKSFTRNAEQNDDITILCLEYKGDSPSDAGASDTIHFDSVRQNVSTIVNQIVTAANLPDDMKFRLAVEEPVQNIADYAYATDGPLDVEIHRDEKSSTLEVILRDSGIPFDPLKCESPDLTTPIADRQVGGLGIFLTRQIMNEVNYRYSNHQNILTLRYLLPPTPTPPPPACPRTRNFVLQHLRPERATCT